MKTKKNKKALKEEKEKEDEDPLFAGRAKRQRRLSPRRKRGPHGNNEENETD